jgi:hypothetical protein
MPINSGVAINKMIYKRAKSTLTPFNQVLESTNLMLPIFFFLIIIFNFHSNEKKDSLIFSLGLIAAIHNLFTLYILKNKSSLSFFLNTFKLKSIPAFTVIVTCAIVILTVLFNLANNLQKGRIGILEYLLLALIILDIFVLSTFHMLKQSFGISIIYDKLGSDINLKLSRKIEYYLTYLLIIFTIINALIFASETFFPFKRFSSFLIPFKIYSLSLAIFSAIALVALSFYASKNLKSLNKFFFSFRYLLWPFYPYSFIALSALRIIHAFEYYCVVDKINRVSQKNLNFKANSIILLIILVYFFILCFRQNSLIDYFKLFTPEKDYRLLFISFYSAVNLTHILFDSMLFRSRIEVFKNNIISPLLSSQDKR